jgi:hypothetical protein
MIRLKLLLDHRNLRQWHVSLLRRLASLPGMAIEVGPILEQTSLPSSAELLFQLETLLYGLPHDGPAARVSKSALLPFEVSRQAADLTIDLSGAVVEDKARVWHLIFDGAAGETALFDIVLEGRVPHAEIVEGNIVIAAARLGTEHGGIALASFEDALARVSTLIVAAVKGCASRALPMLPDETGKPALPVTPAASHLAVVAAKRVARQIVHQLYRLCFHAPHWRVGWRRLDGPDLIDLRSHPATGWHNLPDDSRRFYADPFPILHQGVLTLFVEEYEHRLGKGIISAVTFGNDGPIGQLRPVLEQPGHLSYPFVFEREGQMWMIPESCSAGTIDLFRAAAFPGGWTKEATLVSDVTASDATLVEHGGMWWLFATVRDDGGAYSDALHLWSAPDFRGPWTPHPHNPVLIDIASARPAGRMVMRNNALLRPVQDCRQGYGAALGIARVTRLDQEGFKQEVESIIGPGPAWPGRRLHTLNSAGGFEFIDGSALAPRWFRKRMTMRDITHA